MKFQNRVQRYAFLPTQPNKMHKNSQFVHISAILCNFYLFNKNRLTHVGSGGTIHSCVATAYWLMGVRLL